VSHVAVVSFNLQSNEQHSLLKGEHWALGRNLQFEQQSHSSIPLRHSHSSPLSTIPLPQREVCFVSRFQNCGQDFSARLTSVHISVYRYFRLNWYSLSNNF